MFITGAGSSHFAGYPLAAGLWAWLLENAHPETVPIEFARDQTARRTIELVASSSLEEAVTLLDLASLGVDPLEIHDAEWTRVRENLIGMIRDAFLWHEWRLLQRLDSEILDPISKGDAERVRRVQEAWTGMLQPGDTIITFNWDIMHDVALWRSRKWDYSNGYAFHGPSEGSRGHSQVTLIKLHGSANWAQKDEYDASPSVVHTQAFFGTAGDTMQFMKAEMYPGKGAPLVIPSFLKDPSSNRLLLDLWGTAHEALAQAEEVIVIGYALHPADSPARQLLASALRKNSTVSHITVVAPRVGIAQWQILCSLLDKEMHPLDRRFEDWILEENEGGGVAHA